MSDQHSSVNAANSLGIIDTTAQESKQSPAAQGMAQPAEQGFIESVTTEASTPFTAEEIATTSEEVKKSDQQESDNSNAFDQLLQHYRDMAATTRDLGNRFESLIQQVLLKVPQYQLLFTQVQTYKEWQQAHPELGVSEVDTGIDLVATLREPQNDAAYVAIQCKFYREHSALSMKDLATFLSVSSTPFFASRLLVATNRGLNSHAQKQVANQEKPLQIISLETLRQFPIDWEQFVQTNNVSTLPKRQLRPYQQTAVNNTINGFKDYARGKLIMACGTGKTFTALRIAERQAQQHHLVLFLVPSLSLLSQSMNDWVQQSQLPMLAIPVCSDNKVSYKKVSKHEIEADENVLARNELLYPATTNEHALARSVAKALAMQQKQPQQGLVVVFSTYQSLDVVHRAQELEGALKLPEFDLIISDEAHHTAGAYLLNEESAVAKAKAPEQAPTLDDKPTLGGLPTDDTLDVKAQAQ